MKKALLFTFTCVALSLGVASKAQSTLIHYWNFNSLDTTDQYLSAATVVHSDYSLVGNTTAYISYNALAGVSATYDSTFYDGDDNTAETSTINARFGDTSGHSFRARNPADSVQMLITFPTTGYKNIAVKFATERSKKGAQVQNYSYSIDNGANWLTAGLSMTTYNPDTVFNLVTVSLASDTNVNNNIMVVFRILFETNTAGTSGNDRFDNVTVEGDSIIANTDTTTAAIAPITHTGNECAVYPNPATDNIYISLPATGDRTIAIYSVTGAKVYSTVIGIQQPVNVTALAPGMYYGTVKNGSDTYRFRFVKK